MFNVDGLSICLEKNPLCSGGTLFRKRSFLPFKGLKVKVKIDWIWELRTFSIYNNAFENKNSTQKYCVDCCRKKENYLAWVRTEELWHKILHLQ